MPIILRLGGRVRLENAQERITRMSVNELIVYEGALWTWLEKITKSKLHSDRIVDQLNAIHREIEWRAMDAEWNDGQANPVR
jgi:hypothetical protein